MRQKNYEKCIWKIYVQPKEGEKYEISYTVCSTDSCLLSNKLIIT